MKVDISVLLLISGGRLSVFHQSTVSAWAFINALYHVEEGLTSARFLTVFNLKGFCQMPFCISWCNHVFLLHSTYEIHYTDGFYVEPCIPTIIFTWPLCPFVSPPKFMCLNLMPKVTVLGGVSFRGWLAHEGGAFMSGMSGLTKVAPEVPPHPFPM